MNILKLIFATALFSPHCTPTFGAQMAQPAIPQVISGRAVVSYRINPASRLIAWQLSEPEHASEINPEPTFWVVRSMTDLTQDLLTEVNGKKIRDVTLSPDGKIIILDTGDEGWRELVIRQTAALSRPFLTEYEGQLSKVKFHQNGEVLDMELIFSDHDQSVTLPTTYQP